MSADHEPWFYVPEADCVCQYRRDEKGVIESVRGICSPDAYLDREEKDRVGKLIASAPELMASLQAIIPCMEKAFDFNDGDVFGVLHNEAVDALSSAQQAIAKAT